ncbi:MAG TPA: hypothetical protein VLY22_00420 [Candidatus Nitrosotalea sp.]|nr:hypothetical protein [Candidatus Nitrosotalea sp.]
MEFGWLEVGLTGKTVTGAPYSAQIVSQRTQTLSDGTHVTSQSKGSVSRDSSGRVRREMSMTGLTQFTGAQQPEHAVFINDPVAGYQYVLHSDEKVVDRRPAPAAGAVKDQAAGRPRREGSQVATESLGTQMIEGVSAEGTRITKTIPAGTFGNDKAIQIVIERWYSPDLQTYVLVKQSDPRMGESTMRLTNITRNEPPSSLFAVPSDYSVRDHAAPPEFGPRGGRGGPPKD